RRLVFTREKTQPISPSYRRKKERIVKPRTPMEAFERVRRRDAALAAQRAADRTATAAGARIKEIATEFARKWRNLIPPRQSSPSEPSASKWSQNWVGGTKMLFFAECWRRYRPARPPSRSYVRFLGPGPLSRITS